MMLNHNSLRISAQNSPELLSLENLRGILQELAPANVALISVNSNHRRDFGDSIQINQKKSEQLDVLIYVQFYD